MLGQGGEDDPPVGRVRVALEQPGFGEAIGDLGRAGGGEFTSQGCRLFSP